MGVVNWEYIVVPAPRKAPKVKGAKTGEARFAHSLTEVMNAYGAEGWEYLRCDTLPLDERSGLTGTKTVYQNMLVFRRAIDVAEAPTRDIPDADHVQTPEQLAAELTPQPAFSHKPADPAAPRLNAARDTGSGPTPKLGPAAGDGDTRVHPFPAPDRAEGRD